MTSLESLADGLKAFVLSFLNLVEVYNYGCTSRFAFLAYLREKYYRTCPDYPIKRRRFLASGWKRECVVIASYPRCGNSFLRQELEKWSGIVTGSDTRPNRTLSASLLKCGFQGEGIVDSSVWLVKTHYPERLGYLKFKANRVVLLVRNPFDAIESYFHMGMTNTHNKSLSKTAFDTLTSIWDSFVFNEIKVWASFYLYWLQLQFSAGVKLHVVRYEDMLLNQRGLESTVAFLFDGVLPLYPTIAASSSSSSNSVSVGYTPRKAKKEIGQNLRTFIRREHVQYLIELVPALLSFLGYKYVNNQDDVSSISGYKLEIDFSSNTATWNNELQNEAISLLASSSADSQEICQNHVLINSQFSLRYPTDQFGRQITFLRKALTDDDTKPFETL